MNGKRSGSEEASRGLAATVASSLADSAGPISSPATSPARWKSGRLLLLVATMLAFSLTCSADPVFPGPQGMVNDFAAKLTPATKQQLETLLTNFKDRSGGIEVSVVTIPFDKMGGYPIEDYALGLGRRWGIGAGSDKNGLLLLIAIRPPDSQGVYSGATRLEVSRHLEGDIPDGLAGALISRMRDDFKAGQFDRATTTGVQTILATLADRRGISMDGIDQNYAYQPGSATSHPSSGDLTWLIIIGGILMLFMLGALRKRSGQTASPGQPGAARGRSGSGTDWMPYPIILGRGAGGFGGYRGGSGPFPGGGPSGGFGGFGGGGDFGGGGASDSW